VAPYASRDPVVERKEIAMKDLVRISLRLDVVTS